MRKRVSIWKRGLRRGTLRVLLAVSLLVPVWSTPAWAEDLYDYTALSVSRGDSLTIYEKTFYIPKRPGFPTIVYLPAVSVRKMGMASPKGWDDSALTVDDPIGLPKDKGPLRRSISTEIALGAGPAAHDSDLILLDRRGRIFLFHLIAHPKIVSGKPVYSRNMTWWPDSKTFTPREFRPVPPKGSGRKRPASREDHSSAGIGRNK